MEKSLLRGIRQWLRRPKLEAIDLVWRGANEEDFIVTKSVEGGDSTVEETKADDLILEKDGESEGLIGMLRGMSKKLISAIEAKDSKESLRLAKQIDSGLGKLRRAGMQKEAEENGSQAEEAPNAEQKEAPQATGEEKPRQKTEEKGEEAKSGDLAAEIQKALTPLKGELESALKRIEELEKRPLGKALDGQDGAGTSQANCDYPSLLPVIERMQAGHIA